MKVYGWCGVGDVVCMKNGEHKDIPSRVRKIDGAYIYVHPIGYSNKLIYEVYLGEIYPSLKYKREQKINKLLKEK